MNKENIEWLKKNDINWQPVLIRINEETGKKDFLINDMARILHYKPTYTSFIELSVEELELRQERFINNIDNYLERAKNLNNGAYWVLALDTHDIFIIDVDDKDAMPYIEYLLKDSPYYLSTKKQLPKIFVCDSKLSMTNTNNNVKYCNDMIEIQKGQWSYMDLNTKIMNYSCDIKNVDINSILPSLPVTVQVKTYNNTTPNVDIPLSFINEHFAFKLCQCLNNFRWNEWEYWYKIAVILKSINFSYTFEIWKYFSSKSDKYDPSKYEDDGDDKKLWDNIIYNGKLTLGSLHYWAKEDNESMYLSFFGKNYDTVKTRVESRLFKLNSPINLCVIKDDGDIDLLTKEKCILRFQEETYTYIDEKDNTTKIGSFIHKWLNDPNKRFYEKLVFDPSVYVNPRYYNFFTGFEVHNLTDCNYNQNYVDVINEYIKNRICSKNEEFTQFIIWWFAKIIQKPYDKTRVCVVIKSEQGIGKGILLDFFASIIGKTYYLEVPSVGVIAERFNSVLEHKLLINLNEIDINESKHYEAKLKTYITDGTILIERKGKEPYRINNNLNFFATTNKRCPFYIEHSDRRFVGNESNSLPLTASEINYYVDFFKQKDVIYSYYKYLSTLKLPNDPLEKLRPLTPFYRECKIICSSPITMFWIYYLNNCEEKAHNVSLESLYMLYNEWMKKFNKTREPISYKMFCIDVIKYGSQCFKIGKVKNDQGKRIKGLSIFPNNFILYLQSIYVMENDDDLPDLPDNPGRLQILKS